MADTYPYDDVNMKYDLDRRQYYITKDGFKNLLGIDLGNYLESNEAVNAFLFELSDDVYQFIYSQSTIQNIPYKRYLIAKESKIREQFKRALVAQGRYMVRSSANLIKDMHGINIEKGKVIDLNNLRGDVGISSITISILGNIGLLYRGTSNVYSIDEDGTW